MSGLSPPSSECLRLPFVNSREAGGFPAGSSGAREAARSTAELKSDPRGVTKLSQGCLAGTKENPSAIVIMDVQGR